jgi:prepilin-type N-terminal cleavage/methylation domain-containing protein
MKLNDGFTFVELMIVIAIFAILCTIAIPNFIYWRESTKLQGAVENLKSDLNIAKLSAVRESMLTTVDFRSDRYVIWLDTDGDGDFDANEISVRSRELPNGITIDLAATTFGAGGSALNPQARFNSRGLPDAGFTGTVFFNSSDETRSVGMNRLGRMITQ